MNNPTHRTPPQPPQHERTCPMTSSAIIEQGFLDARARLLDIAAFLDRLDRASDSPGAEDFRVRALLEAARELNSASFGRVERIHNILSDPTTEPVTELTGKGAAGAWAGRR